MEKIIIRKYTEKDIPAMCGIWNEVVEEGVAFPQEETLTEKTGSAFFASQTYCAVAEETESKKIAGLYILHPNNVGRCGHIANASYAANFRILQFNAVVATNIHARHLYERLGFIQLGTIKAGFKMKDGHFEDICPYYKEV